MAVPPEVTIKNLRGTFISAKHLSDNPDELLRLQGMSWFKRQAVAAFNLTLAVKHYTDDAGVEHVDIDQKLSGGIPGGSDNHPLDYIERPYIDDVFGPLVFKSRRAPILEIEEEFLKQDWADDTIADGVIHTVAWSDGKTESPKWKAEQAWGFQIIKGERKHVKRIVLTLLDPNKQRSPVQVRLVYDYVGPLR